MHCIWGGTSHLVGRGRFVGWVRRETSGTEVRHTGHSMMYGGFFLPRRRVSQESNTSFIFFFFGGGAGD